MHATSANIRFHTELCTNHEIRIELIEIGAKFAGLQTLSITLTMGMFVGGIPEAAASGSMLSISRV